MEHDFVIINSHNEMVLKEDFRGSTFQAIIDKIRAMVEEGEKISTPLDKAPGNKEE